MGKGRKPLPASPGTGTGQGGSLNNLAASLSLQGRDAEATLLMEVLHNQHPDYLFARTGLAKAAMRKGDLRRHRRCLNLCTSGASST